MTTATNQDIFHRMLDALGAKRFDEFESLLDPEIHCEWPYVVMQGFPTEMRGARRLRDMLEVSLRTFAPYAYTVAQLHDLADPNALIVEYTSHSTYYPRHVPYSNRYVGYFGFRTNRICQWREYVNPLVVLEALGPGFVWKESEGPTATPAAASHPPVDR